MRQPEGGNEDADVGNGGDAENLRRSEGGGNKYPEEIDDEEEEEEDAESAAVMSIAKGAGEGEGIAFMFGRHQRGAQKWNFGRTPSHCQAMLLASHNLRHQGRAC